MKMWHLSDWKLFKDNWHDWISKSFSWRRCERVGKSTMYYSTPNGWNRWLVISMTRMMLKCVERCPEKSVGLLHMNIFSDETTFSSLLNSLPSDGRSLRNEAHVVVWTLLTDAWSWWSWFCNGVAFRFEREADIVTVSVEELSYHRRLSEDFTDLRKYYK